MIMTAIGLLMVSLGFRDVFAGVAAFTLLFFAFIKLMREIKNMNCEE